MITRDELRESIGYDPETGKFTWLIDNSRTPKGSPAGAYDPRGYLRIQVKRRRYQAHRLAWLLMKGCWPDGEVDHIDGQKSNNAFSNLRVLTSAQNHQNIRRPRRDNIIGFLGVSKSGNRYRARIRVDGKTVNIGTFKTPSDAHAAYVEAKRRVHEFSTL